MTAPAVSPFRNVATARSTWSRTGSGQPLHSGQCSARQRVYRRMYSRCTQALMRLRRLSVDIWPQNAVQNAASVVRWASSGNDSASTSSSVAPVTTWAVRRCSMRRRIIRSAARMISCFESK